MGVLSARRAAGQALGAADCPSLAAPPGGDRARACGRTHGNDLGALRALTAVVPEPIFAGGSGRSGTTLLARLIGHHSRYACVPIEARFHAEPEGLPGLLAGQVTPEEFASRMRDHWWQRIDTSGREAGLDRIASRQLFDAALTEFERAVHSDPASAGATLVRRLLGAVADAERKPCWV